MSRTEPPFVATWMLERLTAAERDEALAGDLLEEFRAGRSIGWYWRQVITAIAIGWTRSIYEHRIRLLFAAIWSLLSPAWELTLIRVFWEGDFIGSIWRMPWPWSTACAIALGTMEALLFIWIGSLLYVALLATTRKTIDFRRLGRGFLMSIVVYFLALACVFAVWITINTHSSGNGADWRTLSLMGEIENFQPRAILTHIPYVVGTACALWGVAPRVRKTDRVPA
jgi:hypothetical protein